MGSSASFLRTHSSESVVLDGLVNTLMPIFYSKEPLTTRDIMSATICCDLVVNETGYVYQEAKAQPNFEHSSCSSWFSATFYDRLFNISSSYRLLYPESCTFNDGGKLISMMYKICELAARENAMESFLSDVARSHFEHGVLVHEFGEFCGCIFWTFSKCLGAEFGSHSRMAWEKLASRVLRSLLLNIYALSLKVRGERGHNPSEMRRDRQHTIETSRSTFGDEDDGY